MSELTEIVLKCLTCGKENNTGKYTQNTTKEPFLYSHGYCSLDCARKDYGEILMNETPEDWES